MKKLCLLSLIVFVLCSIATSTQCERVRRSPDDIKLLVLIIASDQFPVYVELQKMWRSYMHYDPKHVEAYFIKGDAHLPAECQIEGDIIWSRVTEGWVPHTAGILNKTILSLELMMPRLDEFDYVLRTNLSSFYAFPRLLEFLKTLPKKRCYCGSNGGGDSYIASGCGFIMSPDAAALIVKNKEKLFNSLVEDDCAIGGFFKDQGVRLITHDRMNLLSLTDWQNGKDVIPSTMFHFRIKGDDAVRLTNDIYIHTELRKKFYNI